MSKSRKDSSVDRINRSLQENMGIGSNTPRSQEPTSPETKTLKSNEEYYKRLHEIEDKLKQLPKEIDALKKEQEEILNKTGSVLQHRGRSTTRSDEGTRMGIRSSDSNIPQEPTTPLTVETLKSNEEYYKRLNEIADKLKQLPKEVATLEKEQKGIMNDIKSVLQHRGRSTTISDEVTTRKRGSEATQDPNNQSQSDDAQQKEQQSRGPRR